MNSSICVGRFLGGDIEPGVFHDDTTNKNREEVQTSGDDGDYSEAPAESEDA